LWFQKCSILLFMNLQYPNISQTITWLLRPLIIILGLGALLLLSSNISVLLEWHLIRLGTTPLKIIIILDPVGLFYACTVLFIAANVLQFSKFYIREDPFINRFTILVVLFVISIRLLIFIPHFIILLIGWDGLGITSFILVVYYQNPKSLAAGIITALTNRIGDVIILIAIALTLNQGHWNIIHIWNSTFLWPQILIIIVAGLTKRAQIPFSRWLPAAIAAPTPVSALVHSSTLVTAGVFLLIRFYPFLSILPAFNFILLFVAVSTILMAGIRATTECDIKKIIALSTLSQLGIIITRLGLGMPNLALFHIVTHALFKALLFICAGEIIAIHSHGQDLRWFGNLVVQTPIAASCILVANSALCGIPFIAGFYSKDLIMESFLNSESNFLISLLAFIAIGFTSFYTIRFRLTVLWGPRNCVPIHRTNENNKATHPILLISSISVLGGAAIIWLIPETTDPSLLPINLKILPLTIVCTGLLTAWLLSASSWTGPSLLNKFNIINYASCIIWFLVPISSQLQLKRPLTRGHIILKTVDHNWLELLGGQGLNTKLIRSRITILRTRSSSPTSAILKSVIAASTILLIRHFIC